MGKNEFQKLVHTTVYTYYHTPVGTLALFAIDGGIYKASFDLYDPAIAQYTFVPTLDCNKILLVGTPFQCKVWHTTALIAPGSTMHYQELARKIGHPQSSRAIANALADNHIPYLIPCHRVIRKDGSLGGYAWGIERKQLLLKTEGVNSGNLG